jgi:hypothetical protein
MLNLKNLTNWAVLVALVIVMAAVGSVLIQMLEDSAWLKASEGNAALGALAIIAGLAVLNVGVLVGIGICTTRARR